MAQAGMFSNLFNPQVDPALGQEDERLLALAGRMKPHEQMGYTSLSGGAQMGRGLGQVAAGLTGRDTKSPTDKRNAALEAAKAEIAQLGPKPEREAILAILRKHGLLGESLDVGSAMTDQAATAERLRIQAEESERKKKKDLATDARAKERNEILKANGTPELIRMVEIVEQFDPLTQGPQRKMRLEALNAMLESKKKGFALADAGDRIVPVDRATGLPLLSAAIDKGSAPLNEKQAREAAAEENRQGGAYSKAMVAAQADYDAAVRLYNHPGVAEVTGRWGRLVGEPGTAGQVATTIASDAGRAAFELWKQITGKTFLSGLNALKEASPTGSTGLGQVSNIEGDKVQASMAALGRSQNEADFRLNLKVYIQRLENAADALASAAPINSLKPIPLQKRDLTGPGVSAPAPAAAAKAPVKITTDAEYDALDSGTEFVGPDGVKRRKP